MLPLDVIAHDGWPPREPKVEAVDLFGEPAQPAPAVETVDQLDLLDGSRYVRRCGGCSQTVNRCRCAAVGVTEAPPLF